MYTFEYMHSIEAAANTSFLDAVESALPLVHHLGPERGNSSRPS